MKISGKVLVVVGFLCSAMSVSAYAARSDPRRLVVAEKDGKYVFLLPETHIATTDQFDQYFKRVVKPAFSASSKLLVERPDDPQLNEEFRHKPCDDERVSEAGIDSEMNATINAHLNSTIWNLRPLPEPIERFGRFMRFDALLNISTGQYPESGIKVSIDTRKISRGAATVLMADAPRSFESVDTTESYFSAYCALTPDQRTELISSLITAIDQFSKGDKPAAAPTPDTGEQSISVMYSTLLRLVQYEIEGNGKNWEDGLATLQPEQLAFMKQSLATDRVAINRFLISQRNRTWMQQLPAYLSSERLPFYVLGGFHFLDGPYGAGLITLLRQDGFVVSLVRDRKGLNQILSRLPKVDARNTGSGENKLTEQSLPGDCILVQDNYSCGWSDGKDYVSVSKKSSTEELMTVCVQRHSVYGAITNCVPVKMPIPKERANDLLGAREAAQPQNR